MTGDPHRFQCLDRLFERGPKSPIGSIGCIARVRASAIGDLIIAEVLQGCDADDDFDRVNHLLGSLVLVNLGGKDIAVQAAKTFESYEPRV